jgi:predicted dehydrogenase
VRVGFIGVSHWHAPIYYRPTARLAGVRIVAVSDEQEALATQVGSALGAKPYRDYRDLVLESRPDFVFAFGRHCDMAAIARFLIEESVPFMIEKPGGLSYAEVAELPLLARRKGLHAGTGFTYRVSDLWKRLAEAIGDDEVTHASFRYVSGGPYRYHNVGCSWMLDPRQSGGGPTVNFGIHLVDLYRTLCRQEPTRVSASLSHRTWGLEIEDYSVVVLQSADALGTLETGYTLPSEASVFDTRFTIRTRRRYLVVRDDDSLEIRQDWDGRGERIATPAAHSPWYPAFAAESIERAARGQPPLADLDALAGAMRVIDAAYRSGRGDGAPVPL